MQTMSDSEWSKEWRKISKLEYVNNLKMGDYMILNAWCRVY